MRFYHMSLSEVMHLNARQFFYLGERMTVIKAEEHLELLAIIMSPHLKEPDTLRTALMAEIERDQAELSQFEIEPDRAGLEHLRQIFKARGKQA